MENMDEGKATKVCGDETKIDATMTGTLPAIISATSSSSVQTVPSFRFKYKEAIPCPDETDPDMWNKLFSAADSRIYNREKKNSIKSAAARASGETRELALKMLADKLAKDDSPPTSQQPPFTSAPLHFDSYNIDYNSTDLHQPATKPNIATLPTSPLATSNIKMEHNNSRDTTPSSFTEPPTNIADKVKGKSRGKGKKASTANSSKQGSPVPLTAMSGLSGLNTADKLKLDVGGKQASPSVSHQGSPPPSVTENIGKMTLDLPKVPKVESEIVKRSIIVIDSDKAASTPLADGLTQPSSKPKKRKPRKKKGKSTTLALTTTKETKGKGKSASPDTDDDSEESESNDGGEYCICRGPDDHRKMIACDACDEWYHCSCVNVNEDHILLIDKYICDACKIPDKRFTTWKPTCRLRGCNKPARADINPPSKYCSDAHKKKWAEELVQNMPKGSGSSRGGALTRSELKAVLDQTAGDVNRFHALGAKPELPASRAIDWNKVLTSEEKGRLCVIKVQRIELDARRQGFNDRAQFLKMAMQRTRTLMDENAELAGICGYDSRSAFNEAEFAAWRQSVSGKKAFETGKLVDGIYCDKKKCDKHKYWLKVGMQDANYEVAEVQKAIDKLRGEEHAIQQRANTREATKM